MITSFNHKLLTMIKLLYRISMLYDYAVSLYLANGMLFKDSILVRSYLANGFYFTAWSVLISSIVYFPGGYVN